jgi:fused signal recognition particle receptor
MIQTLFGNTEEKPSFFERMKQAVARTRENLTERIEDVAGFRREIDRETLDDLEATLLAADLGSTTTGQVLASLREKVDRKQIGDVDRTEARAEGRAAYGILNRAAESKPNSVDGEPEVILVVGVNGTGKTTTIGKLAHTLRAQGKSCAARAPPIPSAPPPSSNLRSGASAPGRK